MTFDLVLALSAVALVLGVAVYVVRRLESRAHRKRLARVDKELREFADHATFRWTDHDPR